MRASRPAQWRAGLRFTRARVGAGVVLAAALAGGSFAIAQDDEFERFKRAAEQSDEFEEFKRAARKNVEAVKEEFRESVAAQDREFADHLRTQWAEFEAFRKNRDMGGPKPRAMPVAPRTAALPPASVPRATAKPDKAARPKTDLIVKPAPAPAPKPSAADIPPPRSAEAPAPKPPQDTPPPQSAQVPPPPPPATAPPRTAEIPPAPVPVPPAVPPRAAAPEPVAPKPAAPVAPPGETLTVDFYGTPVRVPVDPAWKSLPAVRLNPDGLADYWTRVSATRFQPTLDAVDAARQTMQLDDWGQALLWQEVTRALRPNAQREQLLLLWFFLVKSGFDARPGYNDNRLLLLLNVRQLVYGVNYIKVDDKSYYELFVPDDGKAGARYAAYKGTYPGELRPVDIRVAATGFATAGPAKRTLEFESRGKRYKVDVAYERPITRYLDRFPQLDFELYFTTPPSPSARKSLATALAPLLRGLDEEASVDLLLAFVQKAFQYKTDKDQFGREKYFFVEEVLHFPFSDCEDRSVMFSWLVQDLVGLQTVGLHYPGHMTTAVLMSNVKRDWHTVDWRGKRYVIADPTYINANVGMAMPSYQAQKPIRVVEFR